MPSISGQFIVIVGGSSGIGFAVARLALKEGLHVAIVSSSTTRIAAAIDRLKNEFPNRPVTGHVCNLRAEDAEIRLEQAFTEATISNGQRMFNHIVFTAGDQLAIKPLKEIDVNFIQEAGKVRFVAPLLVAKLAPRFMVNSYQSSLILTTGAISQRPRRDWSVVAPYLSGLHAMTRNLAVDIVPIRVNLVSPGAVDTELWGSSREEMVAELTKTSFMGRVADPDEVAEAYIYLMKDTNATGSIVNTNGGALL